MKPIIKLPEPHGCGNVLLKTTIEWDEKIETRNSWWYVPLLKPFDLLNEIEDGTPINIVVNK